MSFGLQLAAGTVGIILLLVSLRWLYRATFLLGWGNARAIGRARPAIQKLVRKRLPKARVHTEGKTVMSPSNLSICINVQTDAERNALLKDTVLLGEMRRALWKARYPEDVIQDVGFSIESQETVTRDFGGSWAKARK